MAVNKRSEVSFSIPRRDVAEETNCCNFVFFYFLYQHETGMQCSDRYGGAMLQVLKAVVQAHRILYRR